VFVTVLAVGQAPVNHGAATSICEAALNIPPSVMNSREIAEKARLRQDEILGKPQRIAPLDRAMHGDLIVAATTALRNDVAGADLPPIPLEYCPDLVATLLHYPELWTRLSALSAMVQSATAKLPPQMRQLAIMRSMWLCGAPYQWGEHLERTKATGLTNAEIERLKQGSEADGWSALQKAILRAAEELHADSLISDETWAVLARAFDESQLIELVVLIGQFTSVAYLLNSLRLRLEGANKGFL
jgi:alkylhydroperoxidase family enzyme